MSIGFVVPALLLLLQYGAGLSDDECPTICYCLGNYVDCSQKQLREVPNPLPSWTNDLDLSLNKFGGNLNMDISHLQLTTLQLNKNFITSFPFFKNKTTISNLNLAHNKIEKLDRVSLENLNNLIHLDMNKNKLEYLEDNTFPPSNQLQILNLNNNLISFLSTNCLDTLTNLVKLKVTHNKIRDLPVGLFKNQNNLELLDLSKNHITVINGLLFKNVNNLQTLILRQNNIQYLLDGSFYGLVHLKSLYLEDNSVSKISKGWLYGLNSLTYLNISSNKIDQIISGWEFCPDLRELDLSHNKLQSIEKNNLESLRKLQKLHLNNNWLSFIGEGSFNNTPSIKTLKMDHNRLAWMVQDVKGPFIGLVNLKKMSLADNSISYIKKEAFYGLDNLIELNLLQNNILEIQEEALKFMPSLTYMYLNSSSLMCDCSLSWLKQPNVFEHLPFDVINVFCGFPEKNRGKSLEEVPLSDFVCLEYNPKPMIIFHPESKMVLERQNITLKCGVNSSSTEKINFIWKKDNHDLELISANHYSSFEVNGLTQYSILNLHNISMSQNGRYQCVASNQYGITYSNRSILTVVVFPHFAKLPGNSSVKTGQTVKLECAANGFPAPQISWQKDGGNDFPAAQERRMQVIAKDDIFLIVNVKLVDMGVYSCTAKNVAGTISSNATLTVLEPPRFENVMFNKQFSVGEEVVLECLNYGSPKPRIKWTKDGVPLTKSNRHYFTAEDQILVIMDTNINDSGTYQCEVINSLGVKTQNVIVKIMPLYQNLIHQYALELAVIAVFVCISITFFLWIVYIYKARHPMLELTNNVDNKSLDSSDSKDSGTGESPKISQELYTDCLDTCQNLNKNTADLSPEINFPLLSQPTVILGEDFVKYKHSKTETLPADIPVIELNENIEDDNQKTCLKKSERPCSIPVSLTNGSQYFSPLVKQSNSYVCLFKPTENSS